MLKIQAHAQNVKRETATCEKIKAHAQKRQKETAKCEKRIQIKRKFSQKEL